jgi:hypothetical protein
LAVRWVPALVLLIVAVALGLHYRAPSVTSNKRAVVPSAETQAERALTLLDVWSQTLGPDILYQRAWMRAERRGNAATAAVLERRLRRDLLRVRRFAADAAHNPGLIGRNRAEARALRATALAWSEWASILLSPTRTPAGYRLKVAAALEAKAIRLHLAAYAVADRSFNAAILSR